MTGTAGTQSQYPRISGLGASVESSNRPFITGLADLVREGVFSHLHVLFIPGTPDENQETAGFIADMRVPVTLHAPYHPHGVNPCWPPGSVTPPWYRGACDFATYAVQETIRVSEILRAPWVVLHAGTFPAGYRKQASALFSRFLDSFDDSRILVENLPVSFRGMLMLGNTASELAEFVQGRAAGVCLDFAHLYCTAVTKEIPFSSLLADFESLTVTYQHLTRCGAGGKRDEHRGLDDPEGDLPDREVAAWIHARPSIPTALEYRRDAAYNRSQADVFTAKMCSRPRSHRDGGR